MLHDSMRELGLDKEIEKAAEAIPDARDRLTYIADDDRAGRRTRAVRRSMSRSRCRRRWPRARSRCSSALGRAGSTAPSDLTEAHASLVADTRALPARGAASRRARPTRQLLEIMMAQDFQDLTGQVIKKLMDVINAASKTSWSGAGRAHARSRGISRPPRGGSESGDGLLNGPQVKPGKPPTWSPTRAQVDDLLDEPGLLNSGCWPDQRPSSPNCLVRIGR